MMTPVTKTVRADGLGELFMVAKGEVEKASETDEGERFKSFSR